MTIPTTLRVFRGASPASIEALLARGDELQINAGTVVMRQGLPTDYALLLLSGRMRSRLDPGDRDLGELWPGSLIGERALFGRDPKSLVTVTASIDSTALVLRRNDLEELKDNEAVLALQRFLIEDMARRLKAVDIDLRRVWVQQDQAATQAATRAARGTEKASTRPAPAPGLLDRLRMLFGGEA